jgi:hypothetical protein
MVRVLSGPSHLSQGEAGSAGGFDVTVRVVDQQGKPVSNVPIKTTVTSREGKAFGSTITTDKNGKAVDTFDARLAEFFKGLPRTYSPEVPNAGRVAFEDEAQFVIVEPGETETITFKAIPEPPAAVSAKVRNAEGGFAEGIGVTATFQDQVVARGETNFRGRVFLPISKPDLPLVLTVDRPTVEGPWKVASQQLRGGFFAVFTDEWDWGDSVEFSLTKGDASIFSLTNILIFGGLALAASLIFFKEDEF